MRTFLHVGRHSQNACGSEMPVVRQERSCDNCLGGARQSPSGSRAHPNRKKPCIWIIGRAIIKPVPTWHSGKSDFARAIEASRNQAPADCMLGGPGKLIGTLAQLAESGRALTLNCQSAWLGRESICLRGSWRAAKLVIQAFIEHAVCRKCGGAPVPN
jgi:hypothetical protein